MDKLTKDFLYKKYVVEKFSMPDIADQVGCSYSNIRYYLKKHGIPIRSRKESLRTERFKDKQSRISKKNNAGVYDRTRGMIEKQRNSMLERSKKHAKGISMKPSGYYEITKGEEKGKHLHVVIMEMRLGRELKEDECVHHIDRDKTNCSIDNLALVTRAGHARLHRFEDKLEDKNRNRNKKGQFA